ncbi:MAG: hypothetical protein LBR89_02775 [Holosporales bacterium]|jgi:hypothetical protein|nr:hypothetical protein [Holosporales bacterium]
MNVKKILIVGFCAFLFGDGVCANRDASRNALRFSGVEGMALKDPDGFRKFLDQSRSFGGMISSSNADQLVSCFSESVMSQAARQEMRTLCSDSRSFVKNVASIEASVSAQLKKLHSFPRDPSNNAPDPNDTSGHQVSHTPGDDTDLNLPGPEIPSPPPVLASPVPTSPRVLPMKGQSSLSSADISLGFPLTDAAAVDSLLRLAAGLDRSGTGASLVFVNDVGFGTVYPPISVTCPVRRSELMDLGFFPFVRPLPSLGAGLLKQVADSGLEPVAFFEKFLSDISDDSIMSSPVDPFFDKYVRGCTNDSDEVVLDEVIRKYRYEFLLQSVRYAAVSSLYNRTLNQGIYYSYLYRAQRAAYEDVIHSVEPIFSAVGVKPSAGFAGLLAGVTSLKTSVDDSRRLVGVANTAADRAKKDLKAASAAADEAKAELVASKVTVGRVEADLAAARGEVCSLSTRVSEVEADLSVSQESLSVLGNKYADLSARIYGVYSSLAGDSSSLTAEAFLSRLLAPNGVVDVVNAIKSCSRTGSVSRKRTAPPVGSGDSTQFGSSSRRGDSQNVVGAAQSPLTGQLAGADLSSMASSVPTLNVFGDAVLTPSGKPSPDAGVVSTPSGKPSPDADAVSTPKKPSPDAGAGSTPKKPSPDAGAGSKPKGEPSPGADAVLNPSGGDIDLDNLNLIGDSE